ncbi:MAG: ABC transporter transmembrane domain-containing protein [Casimicrobiaceae bacterium]
MDHERPETHAGDLARYRRLLGYARPYRWRLVAAALALAFVSLVEPLITLSFAQIVDRGFSASAAAGAAIGVSGSAVSAQGGAMSGGLSQSFLAPVTALLSEIPILWFPPLLVAVFALRGAANFAGDTGLHWVASRVVYDIRRDTFMHLLRLPVAWFDRHPPAELTSRITFDAQQVGQATSQALTALVQDSLKLIAALALMAAVSWRLMLVVFVVAPLVAIVVRSITRRLRAASEAMQTQMGELARFTDEGLRNQRSVKVFSAFSALGERFVTRANAVRQSYMKQERANALATPLIHLSVSFAIAGIVALAILEGQRGRMTAGEFFVFFTALLSVLPPLKALSSVTAVLQRGLAAAGSLFAIADTPAEPHATGQASEPRPAGGEGAIRFERVSFSYPAREEAALAALLAEIDRLAPDTLVPGPGA